MSKSDRHPIGFTCRCGRNHDFPEAVHKNWNRTFEARCKDCGRVWKGAKGMMKLVKDPNWKRPELWLPGDPL